MGYIYKIEVELWLRLGFKGHPGAIFNKIGHQKNPFGGAIGVVRVILTAYLRGRAFIFILVVELV